jgi:27-O-demethylrifamycin SV methyltransferase
MVRLSPLVRLIRADAQALPFRAAAFDAAISQEGLLHVPDKGAVLADVARVLRPRARLAFSDWVARPRLEENERRRLTEWMTAVSLQSIDAYRGLLARAGFVSVDAEDLSTEWIEVLRERLRMYRSLREQTVARLGTARYDEYNQLYAFFVGLVEAGKLGGARFSAAADPAPF